ncbi:glycoside hydrolase family 38 C-terminal domain-containing protein [Biformimicrobium ophioploci]|uniref:Mannosylglycerate hydrolase n=1 Tax=Biformimicrobium ophioploci TaxID=3036711 RepID=A0ABQ6LWL3_9GAMM|nr:glycoside hydrolase family 38 C-terminal domain-containing protein [Microbulbifer sp. NKW57]GMG86468.1 mannosylglycerate hydrolase [Microbulbifer sp. NKW57]
MSGEGPGIAGMSRKVSVIVQTHWDREWYYPHQQFIGRLLRVMAQVVEQLDSGQLQYFLFDGQVSAIEDFYAHAEEGLAARVAEYVRTGRIAIGPWFVAADEFLCAGESLVRNLELGQRRARLLDGGQQVGYLPDTFGHISQMPQLLSGFGISNAVAWRGVAGESSEVIWRAPDGSEVMLVVLTEGYYQHPFNTEDWRVNLESYLARIEPRSNGGPLLLTQGGDHLMAPEHLQDRIDQYNAGQNRYRLTQDTLTGYIDALVTDHNALPRIDGELRANARAFVLPDVLSTRQYLKEANQRLEDHLAGLVEPLLAVALPLPRDQHYPARYLEKTWQLLLEQHAHDSICGCSVDEVHREMVVRFSQLQQRLQVLEQNAQLALGMLGNRTDLGRQGDAPDPFADDSRCTLFNSSPKPFSGWMQQSVFISGARAEDLEVFDSQGRKLENHTLNATEAQEFHSPIDDFPDMVSGCQYELAIHAELGGLELQPLVVRKAAKASAPAVPVRDTIENRYYQLRVDENAGLQLRDKASGEVYAGLFGIVSELDGGDTYNFSPAGADRFAARIAGWHVSGGESGPQHVRLELVLEQPAGLDVDRRGPAQERVRSHGEMLVTLLPDDALIRCRLNWHNEARDQRLRLHIPLQKNVRASASDTAFDWVQRQKVYASDAEVNGQQESPVAVNPSYSAIKAADAGFVHRGLQEYEILCGESGCGDTLGVTLLRSVGWLSRRDLKTRGLGAGPDLATPEAQCLGEHDYLFGLDLTDPQPPQLLNQANSLRRSPRVLRGHPRTELHSPGMPRLNLLTEALQVSSLRRVKSGIEVRVWNPTTQDLKADFGGAWPQRTDLAGNRTVGGLLVGPRQIATFLFCDEEAGHGVQVNTGEEVQDGR